MELITFISLIILLVIFVYYYTIKVNEKEGLDNNPDSFNTTFDNGIEFIEKSFANIVKIIMTLIIIGIIITCIIYFPTVTIIILLILIFLALVK